MFGDRLCSSQRRSIVIMARWAKVAWRVKKEVRWGGWQKDREKEEGEPLARAYRERTRSSTARHQDIRDFDRTARSTTAQSLFVWYPLPLLFPRHASPSTLASVSFPPPFLSFASLLSLSSIAPASTSLSLFLFLALRVFTWTHRIRGPSSPLRLLRSSSSSPSFRSSVIASRSRRPLGFTWRALMTSRNERVPPPSNKRLFHVPMLILRESRLPFPLFLSLPPPFVSRFFVPHIAYAVAVCTK